MAGLKKPIKRESANPSTVLIVFLVFFVLLSIGLGVWGYYGYAGQDELKKTAILEKDKTKGAKLGEELAKLGADDARLAVTKSLEGDALASYTTNIAEVLNDNGRYKGEPFREALKKMIADNKAALGWDEAGKKYVSSYGEKLTSLSKELNEARGQLATAQADLKAMNDNYNKMMASATQFQKDAMSRIVKDNSAILKAAQARTEEMKQQFDRNEELDKQNKEFFEKMENEKAKLEAIIKRQNKQLVEVAVEKADTAAPVKLPGVHALMLDMSPAKTLWDHPLGKVTRVDVEQGHVYINLGSSQGAKPGLTFNVFGAGNDGLAAKQMKGTLEVIRVLDANSSLCRITSLYDVDGHEMSASDPSKSRVQRESENALKEGDLLFNMFWGSRVAIAGNVNLIGVPAETPAEQMRNLNAFMQLLQTNGVKVDAYLDLTDNTVKGTINYKTRFLIVGDKFVESKEAEAPKAKDAKDAKEKEDAKEAEVKDTKQEGVTERAKAINEAIQSMSKEAVDRGMFIISAENFLTVTGYRRPRSANEPGAGAFQPSVIRAGQSGTGPQGTPEKKAPDMK